MVLLGRAIAYSRKLSVQTTVLLTADTASPRFVMQVLAGGMSPQFGERHLSQFSQCSDLSRTDRGNNIDLAKRGTMH